MAVVARTSAFASMNRRAKGTGIILVCTLALAARHESYGGHLLEVARVLLAEALPRWPRACVGGARAKAG